MLSDFLKNNIKSQAGFIRANGYGYGQVEPNHLSAQRTGQIYAQLPAAADIDILENGQFVKYDYQNGVVNFTGAGEWMLVFNEIKLYRDGQLDCEFAMLKDNYQARVYSPFGGPDKAGNPVVDTAWTKQSRWYNGVDSENHTSFTIGAVDPEYVATTDVALDNNKTYYTRTGSEGAYVYTEVASPDVTDIATYFELKTAGNPGKTYKYDDVTAAPDIYEIHYNEDPFHIEGRYYEKMMPEGTTMVPRVFKTNVGDIFTTNTIADKTGIALGDLLVPSTTADSEAVNSDPVYTSRGKGILKKNNSATTGMIWQVVKIYTMPDHQPGVKVMRIA